MDGVLVDTGDFHYQAWVEIYRRYRQNGHELSRAEFDAIFGLINENAIPLMFGPEQSTPDFVAEVDQVKEALFRQLIHGYLTPLPGVLAWLEAGRRAGLKQAVGSSASWLNIQAILTELKLGPFFETIVSGDDVTAGKPAPDIYLEAARRLHVSPAHCLVIEDSLFGLRAARAAGMRCLAVPTLHRPADLAIADWIAPTLAEFSLEQLLALWP